MCSARAYSIHVTLQLFLECLITAPANVGEVVLLLMCSTARASVVSHNSSMLSYSSFMLTHSLVVLTHISSSKHAEPHVSLMHPLSSPDSHGANMSNCGLLQYC